MSGAGPHSAGGSEANKDDKRTSEVLREFARNLTAPRVSFSEIDNALGERGFGVLIAILSLPSAIPGGPSAVPGFTTVVGVPIIILSLQLMMGRTNLGLPGFIERRTFDTPGFQKIAEYICRVLAWFEKFLRPRFHALTGKVAERFLGAFCVILAIILALPIPLGNNLPALALGLIGLGLIEQDGVAILIGVLSGLAGIVVAGLVVFGMTEGALWLWDWFMGLF
jgi:hypothetical protein